MLRAADFLAGALAERGTTHVFGVGGANIEDVYDALHARPGIEPVLAKHEFSAATMADGYARTTNRLGVVMATSGGGALNLIAGLGEAHASRVPVLALVGQPPSTLDGMGSFQDSSGRGGSFDARAVFGAVSRYCVRVASSAMLPNLLDRAITAALAGGPAVLLLPKDVQQAAVVGEPSAAPFGQRRPRPGAARDRALRLLAVAAGQRVLVIAGDSVARAGARHELAVLADALDAAVAVTPDARDVFDNHHPRFAGVAGVMGHPGVRDALGEAALCLLVGTRLPLVARGGLEDLLAATPVMSIDAEAPFVAADAELRGELRSELAWLAGATSSAHRAPRIRTDDGALPRPLAVPEVDGLSYRDVVEAIAAELPDDADVFVDAGNTGASVIHHLPAPRNGRFVVALGVGGMGYSFGAAIGAAFASGRRTYVIAGDGAFYMHGMELHTALQYDLPVTFVVCNNDAHAMCVTREQLYFGGGYSYNRFRHAEIGAGIAAMFPGLPAGHAKTADELRAALAAANATSLPAFVSVDCDPDELPPFLPFLKEAASARIHVG